MNPLIQFHEICLGFYHDQNKTKIEEEKEKEEFKKYFREKYKEVSERNVEGFYQAYWAYLDDIAGSYIDLLEGVE